MTTLHTVSFQKTVLASMIGLCLSQSVFALQEISDAGLSETTGEGIALLPENFALQFNGADDTVGAGYIRYIPVGPLTTTAQDTNKDGSVNASDHSVGKADLYLYGVTLGQSKRDYGVGRNSADWGAAFGGISNTPAAADFGRPITSWGSAENPWLMKVATEQNVPDFAAATPTATSSGSVSYLMLEAPLYSANVAGLSAAEKSAYNLKMGFWADAFVRDQNKAEGNADQFNLGQFYNTTAAAGSRANRLRLQAVWDGLGINGTNLKFFQTLGGATNTGGMSTSYNNTLGMAGVVRLNSGDGATLRATYTNPNTPSQMISSGANAIRTEGAWTMLNTTTYGCGNASQDFSTTACEYRFRSQSVQDKFNADSVWKAPVVSSVLRLSTQEVAAGTPNLATPALGGAMPTFNSSEGVYLYNPNINLVLGTLYQPLTFGVAADGNNLVMELARIPNKESIYKKIYTNYNDSNPATNGGYTGSTCNIYQCGNNGLAGYQGNNATHSSITIGSTVYDSATNTQVAYSGLSAVGVSFGILQDNTLLASTAPKNYTRYQDQQRQARLREFNWTDSYRVVRTGDPFNDELKYDPYTGAQDCTNGFFGSNCNRTANNNGTTQTLGSRSVYVAKGTHFDWVYRTNGDADNPAFFVPGTDAQNTANGAYTNTQIATGNDTSTTDRDYTNRAAQAANTNWDTRTSATVNKPNWENSTISSALVGGFTLMNVPNVATINTSPANNFGSAAIDGLLIQHMKITTKGL